MKNLLVRSGSIKNATFYSIILLAVTAFLVFIHLKNIPYSFDDSYIHFRIARHFVETGYPYFNDREPVMASSSSAWTIILFILFSIFGSSPEPVAVFNAVLCVLGAVIFYLVFRSVNPGQKDSSFAYVIPIVYLCAVLPASIGLMETAVSMVVCGFALLLLVKKKSLSLLLLGSLPFFRIEFIFLTGLFALYALNRKMFRFKVVCLSLFLGALPFLVYDLFFFRTIIPNSIIAKSNGYQLGSLQVSLSLLSYIFPSIGLPASFAVYEFLLELTLIGVTFALLLKTYFIHKPPIFDTNMLFLASGLLVCGFYIAGHSIVFPWYSPLFTIPLLLGTAFIFNKEAPAYKILLTLLVLPVAASAMLTMYGLAFDHREYIRFFDENARVARYISIGRDLYTKYPHTVLATSEIGGLGWGFEGNIADGFGLASPAAIKYQDKKKNGFRGEIALGYIRDIKPEIIVSMDIFDQSLRESPLIADYQHILEPVYLPEDTKRLHSQTLWGSSQIDVFIRKDIYQEGSQ